MKFAIGSIIDDVYYVFYTYSIKSSITRRMTGRLAIATLCLNVSSTAFLFYNPEYWYINNLSRIIAAAVHKGTGSQSNNPTYDFKINDINLLVKKCSKIEFPILYHIYCTVSVILNILCLKNSFYL